MSEQFKVQLLVFVWPWPHKEFHVATGAARGVCCGTRLPIFPPFSAADIRTSETKKRPSGAWQNGAPRAQSLQARRWQHSGGSGPIPIPILPIGVGPFCYLVSIILITSCPVRS